MKRISPIAVALIASLGVAPITFGQQPPFEPVDSWAQVATMDVSFTRTK